MSDCYFVNLFAHETVVTKAEFDTIFFLANDSAMVSRMSLDFVKTYQTHVVAVDKYFDFIVRPVDAHQNVQHHFQHSNDLDRFTNHVDTFFAVSRPVALFEIRIRPEQPID